MSSYYNTFYQHIISLGAKLAIALSLLSISRLLLYFFNTPMFPDVSSGHLLAIIIAGLRFDLSALLMVNGVFILLNVLPFGFIRNNIYRKVANVIFVLSNSIALMPGYADVIYYRFTHKRTTGDIFNYLAVNNDLGTQFPQFVKDFWYIFLFWFASIALLIWICRTTNPVSDTTNNSGKFPKGASWLAFAIISVLTIIGIRGGLQLKPISLISACKYTSSNNVPLVLNSPFTIFKTINQKALSKMHYFPSEAQAEELYPVVHHFPESKDTLLADAG